MAAIPCPDCTATDTATQQHLGSEILWFICGKCGHVWCTIVPPVPYRTTPPDERPSSALVP